MRTLLLLLTLWLSPAQAQNAGWPPPAGAVAFLCVYNATAPVLTDTQVGFVQCDSAGNLITTASPSSGSAAALTGVSCGSAVSSCVLKASAGNLYGVYADCTSACWVMVFNSTSAPSNGATTAGSSSGNLVDCFEVSAGTSKSLTYPTYPRRYSVGITAAISSTACATLTLSTVGFVSGTVK